MHNPELIIAPVFFISFFGMIFGIYYMRNKENMALIDKGINPRAGRVTPRPFISLKFGLLLTGAGLGLLLAFLLDQTVINHRAVLPSGEVYQQDFPQLYLSMIGLFGGLGLVISYLIERKDWIDRQPDK